MEEVKIILYWCVKELLEIALDKAKLFGSKLGISLTITYKCEVIPI